MMDSFSSLSTMLSSLQQRLQDIDSLQRTIMKLYGSTTTWIQMILITILIFIITSIPGVFFSFDWLFVVVYCKRSFVVLSGSITWYSFRIEMVI